MEFLAGAPPEEELAFERLCTERPAIATDLRALYAHWRGAAAIIEALKGERFSQRLGHHYGDAADPGVSLQPEPETRSKPFDNVMLERLSGLIERNSRYKVLGDIATGGMSTVLKVWDREFRRTLAMKVAAAVVDASGQISSSRIGSSSLAYFLQEAQIMGQLEHPGVVAVHDLGVDSEGQVYFTMTLVRGEELRRIIQRVHDGQQGWTLTRALGVMLKVCETIAFAHSRDVVHRDIKPSNIMVGPFGEVFVMDWGLARLLGEGDLEGATPAKTGRAVRVRTDRQDYRQTFPDLASTVEGQIVGTPAFMPPEQASGDLDRVGITSDIYSLGATLYTLLAGRMPYVEPGEPVSPRVVVEAVVAGSPKALLSIAPGVPAELVAVCDKAMARDPRDRYPNVEDFAEDLRAYLDGRVVRAHREGRAAEVATWVRRNKVLVTLMVVATLAIAVAAAATTWRFVRGEPAREQRAVVTRLCHSIQENISKAHLWFEEALAGDASIDLDRDVHTKIGAAVQLAETAIRGGDSDMGRVEAVQLAPGDTTLQGLVADLQTFAATTVKRWAARDSAGKTGGDEDQIYDDLYKRILTSCNAVVSKVSDAVERDWKATTTTSLAINLLVLTLFGAAALFLGRRLSR